MCQKNWGRQSEPVKALCQKFKIEIKALFDISPANVANEVDNIKLDFLNKQKSKTWNDTGIKTIHTWYVICFKFYSF